MSSGNSDDYEIGYGKPPKHTRFKKGQSGNPKGRPKRRTDIAGTLSRLLDEPIAIRENEIERNISAQEALYLTLANRAIQGDQNAFSELMKQAQQCGLMASRPAEVGQRTGGFLLVPDKMSEEEWERAAIKQQKALAKLVEADMADWPEAYERYVRDLES